jgi:hypothetical protein
MSVRTTASSIGITTRRTVIAAASVFAVAFVFYAWSLPYAVATGDTAEYQTVPYILGIAHPTGFPLYTLIGWLFSHIVAVSTVAWRLNLFAALCTALTASGISLLALALGSTIGGAIAAGIAFAAGAPVWRGAVHATPHTLSGMLIVFALAASVAYDRTGRRALLFAACACVGCGLAVQPETLWVIPAVVIAATLRRETRDARTIAIALVLAAAPLVSYAYLPIRSAIVVAEHLDPTQGAPLNSAGSIDWNTNDPRTSSGFFNEVLGRHEDAPGAVSRSFAPPLVGDALRSAVQHALLQYGGSIPAIAIAGALLLALQRRRELVIVLAGTIGGVNFAQSYRLDNELDRYYLVLSAVTAALAAASTGVPQRYVSALASATLAVSAAVLIFSNRGLAAELRAPGLPPLIIDAVKRDTPDGTIIVAPWHEALTLGYASAIDHALGSRTIIQGDAADYVDDYQAWVRTRRVVLYVQFGRQGKIANIPSAWQRELASSLPFHRVVEIIAPGSTPTR